MQLGDLAEGKLIGKRFAFLQAVINMQVQHGSQTFLAGATVIFSAGTIETDPQSFQHALVLADRLYLSRPAGFRAIIDDFDCICAP